MKWAAMIAVAVMILIPPSSWAGSSKDTLWDKYDTIREETEKRTEEMFNRFQESLNKTSETPERMSSDTADASDGVKVEGLAPVAIQPWQLECADGYDNGSYKGKSYCIKCPPNSHYRSTVGACVGCPPGYAADFAKPGQLCFRCPPGYQTGYRPLPEGGGENVCVKCPPGYMVDWKDKELPCMKIP